MEQRKGDQIFVSPSWFVFIVLFLRLSLTPVFYRDKKISVTIVFFSFNRVHMSYFTVDGGPTF